MVATCVVPSSLLACPYSAQAIQWNSSALHTPGLLRRIAMHSPTSSPRRTAFPVRCEVRDDDETDARAIGRRQGLLALVAAGCCSLGIAERTDAKDVAVGVYLPPVPSVQGFVQFKATNKDTPALRAGNVDPYQFILPPSWKQARVANILSGNYCQPKCAEPWVEVKFESDNQGSAQVVASPMVRLTNKLHAKIEEIGNPEKLIAALGPFVTGNSYDPDEVIETSVERRGSQTYYVYTLNTPYARTGTHNLAMATAKGNVVLLFVVSANDEQWSTSKNVLKTVLESFKV